MSEEVIPSGEFTARCSECSAPLMVEQNGAEVIGDEPLVCPIHGTQGTVQELRNKVEVQVHAEFHRLLHDGFKRSGFSPK